MPKTTDAKKKSTTQAAMSPETIINRCISKSYKAVEKRIDSGEATAAELVHFLRQGSIREQLELEKLKKENELLKTKADSIKSQEEIKTLYADAIGAFRRYSGQPAIDEEDIDD